MNLISLPDSYEELLFEFYSGSATHANGQKVTLNVTRSMLHETVGMVFFAGHNYYGSFTGGAVTLKTGQAQYAGYKYNGADEAGVVEIWCR